MNRGDHLGGGRYTLLDELGRGGMGIVWLAEDKTIGRRVAVKELLLPRDTPPHERQVFEERVLREARTAGRLNDPGIVTVYDVLQEHNVTFIVMELVEAPDLSDIVRQHGPLSSSFVAKIAEQLLSALETAHAAGIVHRDVKPANVMVAQNGRVKLADFGIAQSIEDPRLTTAGTLVGSPTYISPERLRGQDASPASDLWALGATLFFAVEGYGAYERPTTVATIQAIMHERAQVRLAQGPVADLIMGLLNPAPEARLTPPQARQLIEQARAADGPTGEQKTVNSTLVAPMKPPASRNKRWLAVAGAAAMVAILATAGILAFGSSDKPSTPGPASTSSSGAEKTSAEPTETDESTPAEKPTDKSTAPEDTSKTGEDCTVFGLPDPANPSCEPTSPTS